MANPDDESFSAGRATDLIRDMARSDEFGIVLTRHAAEQMSRRDLILDDVLYVLKHGFVYERGEPSNRPGEFTYGIECRTPNSGRRSVRAIAIPSADRKAAKIVTVMWADEPMQRG